MTTTHTLLPSVRTMHGLLNRSSFKLR